MSATAQTEGTAELPANVVQLKPKTHAALKEISQEKLPQLYAQGCRIVADLPFDSAEAFMVLAYAVAIRARLETVDAAEIIKMFDSAREQIVAATSAIT